MAFQLDGKSIATEEFIITQLLCFKQALVKEFEALTINLLANPAHQEDPLLSEEELARRLDVCNRTIRNRLKAREMAYTEIKGKRYVRLSELDRYINRHTVPAKLRAA